MSLNPSYIFERVDLAALDFSKSIAQAERRKHFDQAALTDLTENIKVSGVMQPITIRKNGKPDRFEVVAGERRVIAARKAGHELIPAIVRELTDDEAIDLQLVENLQREGLHELVEAEGYEDLRKRGHSIEQIAERLGKSTSYVYKRLELGRCSPESRKAFYAGTIDASKALLISQLRTPELQKKFLAEITRGDQWDGPMSFRDARDLLRDEYLLRLDQAPFKTEDAALVAAAGACGKCPKNTASQKGLFGDVSKDALCTDSVCFKSKVAAHTTATVDAARKAGQEVIEGKAAASAIKGAGGFAKLTDRVPEDSKYRTYEQLLGKSAEITVAVDPDSDKVVELVRKADALKTFKAKGVKLRPQTSNSPKPRSAKEIEAEKAAEAKIEAEEKLMVALGKAIYEKAPKPFTRDELEKIAEIANDGAYGPLNEIIGETTPKFEKLNEAGLIRFIRIVFLSDHIDGGDKGVVIAEAKRHGVNVEKIKAELAGLKPTPASAAAAKKKAAKKK